uniref:Uncharacterized protein n=1 Tax=Setaria viridis TaxID=4556 RepID=A0A4U6WCR1_SETVI|nr:hypothetical protein SEVIR_1G247300v2 [Setaria viridis]
MTFLLKFSFLSGPRSRFRPAAARSSSSRSAASPPAPATSAALFFLLLWQCEPGPFSSGCPTPCWPAPSPPHPGGWQPELTRIRRPSRSQLHLRDDAEIVGLYYDAAASSSASVNDASSDSLSSGGAHPARCRPACGRVSRRPSRSAVDRPRGHGLAYACLRVAGQQLRRRLASLAPASAPWLRHSAADRPWRCGLAAAQSPLRRRGAPPARSQQAAVIHSFFSSGRPWESKEKWDPACFGKRV